MKFIDFYNTIVGAFIAIMTALFGADWYLFAAYLILNIADWITGWLKARKLGEESSYIGMKGILKKLGYWLIILISWLIPTCFIAMGDELGIKLDFLQLFGWFVLAMLFVNEIRSILENLVELGYKVPNILIKGLAVTERLINTKSPVEDEEN